ncbi:MAG: putative toxin-antitoxin system toxin component, PIN family [Thermomicrobiales bacterium]
MKAIVDANVFVSVLLTPDPTRIPTRIVAAALARQFELLVSEETLDEIARNVAAKPYLRGKIPPDRVAAFFGELRTRATIMPELATPIPSVTRDPKDDYLIAHAIAEDVDILVSGDRDLLALDGAYAFRILAPAAFISVLDEETST